MTPQVSFQAAQLEDMPAVVGMMGELYRHGTLTFHLDRARNAVAELLNAPDLGCAWLILAGGVTLGYLVVTFGFSVEFGGRFGLLDELFVLETHRNQGIGTDAIQFACEECQSRNIKSLRLEVTHSNGAAQRLYQSLGFELLSRNLLSRWVTD